MAKLILTDNYNRETVADVLVEDHLSNDYAQLRADAYNDKYKHANWDWFAKAVPDDYKLWRGMQELV